MKTSREKLIDLFGFEILPAAYLMAYSIAKGETPLVNPDGAREAQGRFVEGVETLLNDPQELDEARLRGFLGVARDSDIEDPETIVALIKGYVQIMGYKQDYFQGLVDNLTMEV